MRPARALGIYILFVFLVAALLSPWVYAALVAAGAHGLPFRRVVDRCLMALALIGVWPLVRALGIRSGGEIGLVRFSEWKRDLGAGLSVGTVLMLLSGGAAMAAGTVQWDNRHGAWAKQIAGATATAIAVAVLEEILFRGAIYTTLRRAWGLAAGLWASSAIFGILHFFAKPENPEVIGWSSGFVVLGQMLAGFTDLRTVVPPFFELTLLGVMLALAFEKTRALYMPIGIHAALVFWVKLFGYATTTTPGVNTWFWGTEKLVDGWFCFILMIGVTSWFARWKVRPA